MMGDGERLKRMGRLEENKLQAREAEIRMQGLVESLREHLDPFEKLDELNTDLIASQALELARLKIDYTGLLDSIRAIEKALGR